MLQKNHNQRSLAGEVGCTPAAITMVIKGKTRNRKMHEKIVNILGISLSEFWPEIYGTGYVDEVDTTSAPC